LRMTNRIIFIATKGQREGKTPRERGFLKRLLFEGGSNKQTAGRTREGRRLVATQGDKT